MMTALVCSILVLAAIGWMLQVNSNDRKLLEKELEEALADEGDS